MIKQIIDKAKILPEELFTQKYKVSNIEGSIKIVF